MNRTEAAAEIARRWNASGRRYGVVHGIDAYPDATGRDIDVLVPRAGIETALAEARDVLAADGWRVVEPPPIWGRRLVAIDPGGRTMLEVHLHDRLAWRNVTVVDRLAETTSSGPFAVDPWAAWAKRVLLPLLAGATDRLRERRAEIGFREGEKAAARRGLPAVIGRRADRVIDLVERSDVEGLVGIATAVRRAAVVRAALRRPLATLVWPLRAAARRAQLPFRRCAPIVAIVGPDGAGKGTLIGELTATPDWVFNDVVVRHWRPGLLPRLGAFAGRPAPRADAPNPPRREAGRAGWARVLYYGLDVALGGWLVDRPLTARQVLVVYDRCFLDMAVDPLRYGLGSANGVLRLWRWLPQPDRVIALQVPAATAYERKGEQSPARIDDQLARWRELATRGDVDDLVDADRPPADVALEVRRIVLDAFLSVNAPAGASS